MSASVHIPVLLYHHVNGRPGATTTHPSVFHAHLRWLADRGWRSVTLAEFEAAVAGRATLGPRRFLLTYDDGSPDLILCASQMRVFGFTGVAFLNTGRVQREDPGCLSSADALLLAKQGTLEFQSHTHEHARFDPSGDGLKKLAVSLSASRLWLEQALGLRQDAICHLAWPWGHCTPEMESMAREMGFGWQYLVQRGMVTRTATPLRLPRLCVDGMSAAQFSNWMTLLSFRSGGELANLVFGSVRHIRHGMGYW